MMAALCAVATRAARSFSPQQLANLLWGAAVLKHQDKQLRQACCRQPSR
jgi:hypothetical protein